MNPRRRAPAGLFAGLCTVDLIYRVPALPQPNSKNVASSQLVFAGGPATNAAITYALLGGEATLVSALGTHPLASVPHAELSSNSIRFTDLASSFAGIPAVSSIFVDESNGNRIVVSANAGAIASHPRALPADLHLELASFILFDGHHFDVLSPLLLEAKRRGLTAILDGGSWKPALEPVIGSFDVVIASGNFMPPGCIMHSDVIAFLQRTGVPRAVITRGHLPVLVSDQGASSQIPVPSVAAVDTLGAGDVFHGAFCAAFFVQRLPFLDALAFAAHVASLSTTVQGTRAWVPLLEAHPVAP
ncbi:MAG: PfkB family carbohydrate kinase [Bryobacteraceae bacterium]|nr:PfkB family carbohydrate kinase [Bryobacteraceae bacterium]